LVASTICAETGCGTLILARSLVPAKSPAAPVPTWPHPPNDRFRLLASLLDTAPVLAFGGLAQGAFMEGDIPSFDSLGLPFLSPDTGLLMPGSVFSERLTVTPSHPRNPFSPPLVPPPKSILFPSRLRLCPRCHFPTDTCPRFPSQPPPCLPWWRDVLSCPLFCSARAFLFTPSTEELVVCPSFSSLCLILRPRFSFPGSQKSAWLHKFATH